jgi:hypothetical protein
MPAGPDRLCGSWYLNGRAILRQRRIHLCGSWYLNGRAILRQRRIQQILIGDSQDNSENRVTHTVRSGVADFF